MARNDKGKAFVAVVIAGEPRKIQNDINQFSKALQLITTVKY
jgi:hypothetical protein